MRIRWLALALWMVVPKALAAQAQDLRTDWGTFAFEKSSGLTEGTVAGQVDSVFARLPEILKGIGIEPKAKDWDPAGHRVQTHRLKFYRQLGRDRVSASFGCGDGLTGPNADNYYVYVNLVIQLSPLGPSKTGVQISMNGEAVDVPGGQSERIVCATTGRVEYRLAELLQKRFPPTS